MSPVVDYYGSSIYPKHGTSICPLLRIFFVGVGGGVVVVVERHSPSLTRVPHTPLPLSFSVVDIVLSSPASSGAYGRSKSE